MKYHFLKALCVIAVGIFSAHADTTNTNKHLDTDSLIYAQSLNATAALVMNWYSSRMSNKQYPIAPLFTDDVQKKYQGDYPDNLIGVTLEKADLITTDNSLTFSVSGQLQFDKNGEIYQKPLTDSFQFQGKDSTQITNIQSINITPTDDVIGVTDKHRLNDKGYYQSRGFAYAWLAYLNGVNNVASWINLADWQQTVDYQLTDRGNTEQGSLTEMLKKSQQQLGSGRYLLKKMTVVRDDQAPHQGTMNKLSNTTLMKKVTGKLSVLMKNILYRIRNLGRKYYVNTNPKKKNLFVKLHSKYYLYVFIRFPRYFTFWKWYANYFIIAVVIGRIGIGCRHRYNQST